MPLTKLDSSKQEVLVTVEKSGLGKLKAAQQNISRIKTNLYES
jgi:hypothetical protein